MALTGESFENLKSLMNSADEAYNWNRRIDSNETTVRPTEFPRVLDTDLTALTREQRLGFEITVGILCGLSLCGNLSTLYVNSRRKMRPFFRTCLISLALSDLLSTIFLTWTHFPQFTAEYVQIWLLSSFMCRFIPLVTTAAILASSMTLVGIAMDRYFAVMKAVISFWDPGVAFCFFFALAIWIVAFGIAIPVCFIYHTISVWILTEVHYEDDGFLTTVDWQGYQYIGDDELFNTTLQPKELVTMCVSDQQDVALYYVIVFSIIFVPCIVAFVWLNSIIAKKIWTRRHRHAPTEQQREQSKGSSGNQTQASTPKSTRYSSAREARHIRMFIVIVVLMAVFIILRLPAWIFLVMRMYGSYTKPHDWIVYFTFGVLNLASCALNPLFYTFLPETLKYITCCHQTLCFDSKKCASKNCSRSEECETELPCCICCGFLCRLPTSERGCRCKSEFSSDSSIKSIKSRKATNFDYDEGVDCSDASYNDDEEDYAIRKQEIFLVYTTNVQLT